eukprot:4248435-Pleurochrysis_carterae.AAC.1
MSSDRAPAFRQNPHPHASGVPTEADSAVKAVSNCLVHIFLAREQMQVTSKKMSSAQRCTTTSMHS